MLKSKIEKELACRLGELSAAEAPTLALLHSRLSTLKAGPIVNDQKVLRKTSSSDSRSIFDKTNYSQRGTLIDVNALRLGMALSENLHHVRTRFHCVLHCARGELPQVFAHPPRRKYADDWLRDGVAI
jgi:hypothetical protein